MPIRVSAFCLALMIGCTRPEPPPSPTAPTAPTAPDLVTALSRTSRELYTGTAAYHQPTHQARLETLKAQLSAAGLPYTIETFEGRRGHDPIGHNVIVPPAKGGSGREILLSAHYDTVLLNDGRLAAGLLDNAASVVAIIEAGRRIRGRTSMPVRLIFFDQEEFGLAGAHAWIAKHGVSDIAAVINADVNGNGDTLMYGPISGKTSDFLFEAVRSVCRELAISCLDFPQYPPGDDRAFSDADVAVVSLGHQPLDEAHKLRSFLLNPTVPPGNASAGPEILRLIHTPEDAIDRIEPDTVAQAADVIEALILKVDGILAAR